MNNKWIIIILAYLLVISICVIIILSLHKPSNDDHRVHLDIPYVIKDKCSPGIIKDAHKKYLNTDTCYNYLGRKVSDVKKEATSQGNDVTYTSTDCPNTSLSDKVAAVTMNTFNNTCSLYSNSDKQLIYPLCNDQITDKCITTNSGPDCQTSAYNKLYAAANI